MSPVQLVIWYFNVCSWQGGDISSLEAKLTLTLGRIFLICWPLLEIMGAILHQHYIIGSLWPPLISSDAALWHSQDGNHAWSSMGYTFTSNPAQSWQRPLYEHKMTRNLGQKQRIWGGHSQCKNIPHVSNWGQHSWKALLNMDITAVFVTMCFYGTKVCKGFTQWPV